MLYHFYELNQAALHPARAAAEAYRDRILAALPPDREFTPLMTAAALGQVEVVQVLLDNNADTTIQDGDGD